MKCVFFNPVEEQLLSLLSLLAHQRTNEDSLAPGARGVTPSLEPSLYFLSLLFPALFITRTEPENMFRSQLGQPIINAAPSVAMLNLGPWFIFQKLNQAVRVSRVLREPARTDPQSPTDCDPVFYLPDNDPPAINTDQRAACVASYICQYKRDTHSGSQDRNSLMPQHHTSVAVGEGADSCF